MNWVELSDLEEGEILEYEFCPVEDVKNLNNSSTLGNCETPSFVEGAKNIEEIHTKFGKELKNVLNTNDLESISSSDGEFNTEEDLHSLSDSNEKYIFSDKNKTKDYYKKKYFSQSTYGGVEGILSELGETLEKNRRSFKKQRSRDAKYTCDTLYQNRCNSFDILPQKVYSDQMIAPRREQKKKKKKIKCDSHANLNEKKIHLKTRRTVKPEIRKDGKIEYCINISKISKKKQEGIMPKKFRDFDAARRNLLEKLKQQKDQEKVTNTFESSEKHLDNEDGTITTEIPSHQVVNEKKHKKTENSRKENLASENKNLEKSCDDFDEKSIDDESDLIKLRLLALASNKKKGSSENLENKDSSDLQKNSAHSDSGLFQENSECSTDCDKNIKGNDFDRNELLLRAEALKTALIKKHKKILSKINKDKPGLDQECKTEKVTNNDCVSEMKGKENSPSSSKKMRLDSWSERPEVTDNSVEISQGSSVNLKIENAVSSPEKNKILKKTRCKKKKRKSESLSWEVKENDKSESLEEDDLILRSRLLSDLIKKKSLENSSQKPILKDSIRPLAGQPSYSSKENERVKQGLRSSAKNTPAKECRKVIKSRVALKAPKPEIQRIIVHLGSEESSEDEENQSTDCLKTEINDGLEVAESGAKPGTKEQALPNKVNYEKSVEILLSQARKKIEEKSQKMEGNFATTPEAVYKHLPLSQRMEYIRLKQKIAEKEKQNFQLKNVKEVLSRPRKQASSENEVEKGAFDSVPRSKTDSGAESKSNPGEVSPEILAKPVGTSSSPPTDEHPKGLPESPEKVPPSHLVVPAFKDLSTSVSKNNPSSFRTSKKYVSPASIKAVISKPVNKKLTLAPSLQYLLPKLKLMFKKIKIEKTIEENYEKEIAKLKSQLNLFERKKSEQRVKIKNLAEESMKIYKALKSIKVSDCPPPSSSESPQVWDNGETQSSGFKPSESDPKDGPETHITEKEKRPEDGNPRTTPSMEFQLYESPLQVFNKESALSVKLDPNAILCHFDLMGICKDEECSYQHLRTS